MLHAALEMAASVGLSGRAREEDVGGLAISGDAGREVRVVRRVAVTCDRG